MGEFTFQTLLSRETLLSKLADPQWRIIDCRFSLADTEAGRRAYHAGHIPGAVYAHLDEDLSGALIPGKTGRHPLPEREAFIARLCEMGIDRDVQVVAYDDKTGMVAARLWWLLRSLGHFRVAVLDGGFAGWQALQGAPITNEVPDIVPRKFIPVAWKGISVNAEEVEQIRKNSEYVLIDSREPYRFRGESEPIDPIAGHIPGAVNAFFMDNLNAEGYFLSKNELRQRFAAVTVGKDAQKCVFYCGSGVSACHNILALAHAGLGDALLYPGSWSEWITDSERPTNRD
jgi:thiosulfate/3-mercaptopyruvate sulfurtransferase